MASQELSLNLTVQKISEANLADFFDLHSKKNGEGWCNCIAWHVPTWDGWGTRSAEQNLSFRKELFARGEYDGYLLYSDATSVGWCQCGPRDRLTKLLKSYNLEPSSETWAVTCFLLAPSHRGKGYSVEMLKRVLKDLSTRGVKHVQGFPKRSSGLNSGHVWTGPEKLFLAAGFVCEREHEKLPVYGFKF